MLTTRSDQRGLWEADRLYIDHVGSDSFYGLLASLRGQLFRDEEFADLYCPDNGRGSVPPSLLATALLLQAYDRTGDSEAKARADFDIRWKVALDTTNILGRGAVKDSYNLLADSIVQLLRALAEVDGAEAAAAQGYDRYLGARLKGEADIDWADATERQAFLGAVVSDADRLLDWARQAQARFDPESSERRQLVDAAQLLAQLLLQDVERTEEGPALRDGP